MFFVKREPRRGDLDLYDQHKRCHDAVREDPAYRCACDCPAMRYAVLIERPGRVLDAESRDWVCCGSLVVAREVAKAKADPELATVRVVSLRDPSGEPMFVDDADVGDEVDTDEVMAPFGTRA